MLREQIDRLDAVLFTHAHRDHTAGLDDVRAYNFMQQIDMPVYGTAPTLAQLRIEYAYAFAEVYYPGIPRLTLYEIDGQPFEIQGVKIAPLPVMHLKLPVLGFRIGNFSYITDANFIPDDTMEALKGTEILVLNALQREPHISHFNLTEAVDMVGRVKPRKAYFTHISHKLGLHSAVERELPQNVHLSYDGLQFTL
jgi:phosphoribosyl 1,2-cyclic phosphate phosphodiesterase